MIQGIEDEVDAACANPVYGKDIIEVCVYMECALYEHLVAVMVQRNASLSAVIGEAVEKAFGQHDAASAGPAPALTGTAHLADAGALTLRL